MLKDMNSLKLSLTTILLSLPPWVLEGFPQIASSIVALSVGGFTCYKVYQEALLKKAERERLEAENADSTP